MNEDLVSVVIPVYNVEKYLRQCLDSVKNQTYKNLEIIVVDDGSTDNSGKICDEYSVKDSRIKVIHKTNEGLSAARNCALNSCSHNTKFLMFVDSDDWLVSNAIEILVKSINCSNSDIVCFNYVSVYKNKKYLINTTKECNYTTEDVKEKLLYDFWLNSVWDKFYKFELFESLRFCENKKFEDSWIMPKILLKTNKIFCIKDYLYYYNRTNINSIMNNMISSKNFFDIYFGWKSHLEVAIVLKKDKLISYCENKSLKFAFNSFVLNKIDNKLSIELKNELLNYLKNKKISIYKNILINNNSLLTIYAYLFILFLKFKYFFRKIPFIYNLWLRYKISG